MNRQQIRANVDEYRHRASLLRQFKRRQQALRGQRGSSTGLQHSLAMDETLRLLTEAGHTKLVGLLKKWREHYLRLAALEPSKAGECRSAARECVSRINGLIDLVPMEWPEKKRTR